MIRFEHVSFTYPDTDRHALDNVSLHLPDGEFALVVGPSGSGKSTLIRCINRLEEHQRGQIIVDGIELTNNLKNIEKIRAEVGMVFQHFNLFPHLTIVDNLALGPIWVRKVPKKEAVETAMYYLEKVHIADQAKKFPGQLSGGQQQRVAIARALCMEPKIMLFDEPTSALDTQSEALVQEALDRLMEGRSTLVVAHRLSTIRNADLILVMDEGDIVEQGQHNELLERGGFYATLYNSQFDLAGIEEAQVAA